MISIEAQEQGERDRKFLETLGFKLEMTAEMPAHPNLHRRHTNKPTGKA